MMDLQLGKCLGAGNTGAMYLEGPRYFMERKMKRNKRYGREKKMGTLIFEIFNVSMSQSSTLSSTY